MENETAKLETIEELREAIGVLAAEVVSLKAMTLATGQLIKKMDPRITLLTALVDYLYGILEKRGWASPRPKGGHPVVN